jgi:hypothetical protein
VPPEHTPLVQSAGVRHDLVSAHFEQTPPPQSTSVSAPFFTVSEQVGAWHLAPVHTPLEQSPPARHALPTAHPPHVPPPQSTSVSAPFFTVSVHSGA